MPVATVVTNVRTPNDFSETEERSTLWLKRVLYNEKSILKSFAAKLQIKTFTRSQGSHFFIISSFKKPILLQKVRFLTILIDKSTIHCHTRILILPCPRYKQGCGGHEQAEEAYAVPPHTFEGSAGKKRAH